MAVGITFDRAQRIDQLVSDVVRTSATETLRNHAHPLGRCPANEAMLRLRSEGLTNTEWFGAAVLFARHATWQKLPAAGVEAFVLDADGHRVVVDDPDGVAAGSPGAQGVLAAGRFIVAISHGDLDTAHALFNVLITNVDPDVGGQRVLAFVTHLALSAGARTAELSSLAAHGIAVPNIPHALDKTAADLRRHHTEGPTT